MLNRKKKFYSVILGSLLVLSGLSMDVSANERPIQRLSGATRVETSKVVSNDVYTNAETVVIAGYHGEVDALTASIIAEQKKAPLLMISNKKEDIETAKNEIERLNAKHAVLLGDEGVISPKIVTELEGLVTISRTGGHDRFDTAVEIAELAGENHRHIFLTNDGRSGELADALAIGPVSARDESPILLTSATNLPTQTVNALRKMRVEEITIIGGPTAVSQEIEKQLAQEYKVQRIAGNNRWKTATQIAQEYFDMSDKAILTNDGRVSYADAVIAGYLGAQKNAPVLLTQNSKLNHDTKKYLEDYSSFVYAIGSESVLSEKVVSTVEESIIENYKNAIVIESVNTVNGIITVRFREPVTEIPKGLVISINDKEIDLDAKIVDGNIEINVPIVEPSKESETEVKYSVKYDGHTANVEIIIPAKLSPIEMRTVESIEDLPDLDIAFGSEYQLPANINVILSDQEIVRVPVRWSDTEVDVRQPGSYELDGQLDFSKITNLKDRETQHTTTIGVNVLKKVLVKEDLQNLIDSIGYVDVSEDGLDIDVNKEWTNRETKDNLEQTVAKVRKMLAGEEYDHVVKKDEILSLETGTFYRKIDGEWIVKNPSILKVEETGSYSSSFGSSIRIVYTVKVSGLKQGYSQLEYIDETGEVLSTTIIKVVDESIPEFTQEELRSAMKELNEAIDNYEDAKKLGNKLSPTEMLQSAKDAVTKAEENKAKSDIYAAKRLVDLLPATEDKEHLENRLENLILEVAVPVTLLSYTGTSKEVEIPKFIDSQKIIDSQYGEFEIEGNLGNDDLAVVVRIEGYAFYDLGLTEIVIPNTVKEIGAYSFGNNNLTELTIPDSLSIIAPYSFYNAFKYSSKGYELIIPETVKEIGESAFSINNLDRLLLPEGLEKIGRSAFSNNQVKSVKIPISVTEIEARVFYGNELESVSLPETITKIGSSAFNSNELETIDLPSSITDIGASAFSRNKLETIDIPAGVSVLSNAVFSENRLRTVIVPENIKEIGYKAFDRNILTEIKLPDNVKIGREILGSSNQLRDAYESEGKAAGTYRGTQYDNWIKNKE